MTEPMPTTASADRMAPERFAELTTAIEREVGAFIVGQQQLVRQTLISLLAGSHALLEGVPGLGKTML
ncbi:MAG TPA: AAA family ATPase, partial [Candidatus Limnocylindria bacterium]